jgi:hypothetical protein
MTVHVFFTYPETACRSLEEVDILFDTDIKPWRSDQVKDIFTEEVERHRKNSISGEKDVIATHSEEV